MSAPAPPAAGVRPVVLAACLVTTLVPFGSTSLAVALPEVRAAAGVGTSAVVTLVTCYLVVTAACQPVAGSLGERWGHRRSVLLGTAGSGAAALLAVVAAVYPLLLTARCLQAVCGAVALVNAAALVRRAVPEQQRGRAFGAVAASATTAAAAGPVAAGAAVHLLGWRGAFVAVAPVALIALLAAARWLPADAPSTATDRFDLAGAGLLLAVLGGGSALLTQAPGLSTAVGVPAALCVLGLALLFARHELATPAPVLDVRVLRLRPVAAAGAAVGSANLALYTVLLAVPLLVGSAAAVALLLSLLGAATVGSLLGGRMTDRLGRRTPAVAGSLVMAVAALLLVGVDLDDRGATAVLLAALGAGQGLAAAAVQTAAVEALPPERAGLASGVWSSCRYVGSIVGSSVLTLLVAPGGGQRVFVLAAVGGALAVLASTALPTRSR